ncbi:recombinase family protein [Rossellomorea sp. DA94]|uniref:recombinase family protein n=1 Tax=Rossellomorea sp. DA94 TaxID=3038653 RepID=UPI002447C3DE|nr:recombinase family protein [Rossellomorea sp. DA94]WGG44209.1 recombinase family protein [Rossellomorea sp. DA94]
MKAAVYVRVSTTEQAAEGYSIRAQTDRLKAYCVSQGWDIFEIYIDDGYSAKDTNRPNLERMMKHIEQNLIDCVLVYRLDRLTRSVRDLYNILETFDKYDCKFKSATEVYDTTTAMGRMFITIVAALAQWERENTGERIRMGMEQKAREGNWVINQAPYGYDLDKENKSLKINEEEALTVQRIFNYYIEGKGTNSIAVELNRLQIRTKTNTPWNDFKVRYILTNPTYIGTMRYNYRVNKENYFEVENTHPPIVTKEVFNNVQGIIKSRRVIHPRAATSKYIFSGTARCARCGSALTGKYGYAKRGSTEYKNRSYYCANSRLGECDQRQMSERYLETQFIKYLDTFEINPEIINDLTKMDEIDESKDKLNLLNKELKEIEKRRKKWQYAWVNEMISDEDFSIRMEEENTKEEDVNKQLSSLQPAGEKMSTVDLTEILLDIKTNWNQLDALEKKMLLQMFTKRIFVDRVSDQLKPDCLEIKEVEFY